MKINREAGPPIVIGKRVALGQIIAGCVTITAFVWDAMNPDNPLPTGPIMAGTQALTGIVQVIVVNRYGTTQ